MSRYPTAEEGLAALTDPPDGVADWAGPYLSDASLLKDPWGADIVYAPPPSAGEKFRLTSYGSDQAPGASGFKRDIILQATQ